MKVSLSCQGRVVVQISTYQILKAFSCIANIRILDNSHAGFDKLLTETTLFPLGSKCWFGLFVVMFIYSIAVFV